ncbi:MAG: hypothetical protein QOG76_8340 [Pseudonocardiales bacterium]|jgi:choline monooxygenase|nr:hypothetical protein [Pseudonocardiales bacterium]
MLEPAHVSLFNPALYSGVRQPLQRATTLPSWCYTSQKWFDREFTSIFQPAWHFIGLASSIPNRGDYLTSSPLGLGVLVVRDDEGQVNAFRNSCRHRGSLLLEKPSGTCRAIRCQYHSWTYSLEGRLLKAPGMEKQERFDPTDRGLLAVRCEVLQGLVFVTFSSDTPLLGTYLGDFEQVVAAPRRISEMVCVHQHTRANFTETPGPAPGHEHAAGPHTTRPDRHL